MSHCKFLNGLPVRFKFNSQQQQFKIEKNWGSITSIHTAEVAGSAYFSSLEREMAPDLLIFAVRPHLQKVLYEILQLQRRLGKLYKLRASQMMQIRMLKKRMSSWFILSTG